MIYTGEQTDHIFSDLADAQLLGWASHVKCKTGGNSKFSGPIHTQDLVATSNPYANGERAYDKDYKRIVRSFYALLPGECKCANLTDRMQYHRCNSPEIKVKLVNSNSYFISVAKYIIGIYTEEQVTVAEFTDSVDGPETKPKQMNKFYFRELICKHQIINEKHYQAGSAKSE